MTCSLCRQRVHVALIRDIGVMKPVCLSCDAKRQAERKTYPIHYSQALMGKRWRLVGV